MYHTRGPSRALAMPSPSPFFQRQVGAFIWSQLSDFTKPQCIALRLLMKTFIEICWMETSFRSNLNCNKIVTLIDQRSLTKPSFDNSSLLQKFWSLILGRMLLIGSIRTVVEMMRSGEKKLQIQLIKPSVLSQWRWAQTFHSWWMHWFLAWEKKSLNY